MDATAVLPKPAPAAPNYAQPHDQDASPEEFAAHLPREEDTRPAPRRADTDKTASEHATTDKDAAPAEEATATKPDDPTSEACASMTTPMAPVDVRPQNSVVTFDLSALLAESSGATSKVAETAGQKAPTQKSAEVATPQTPTAAAAPAQETPAGAEQAPVAAPVSAEATPVPKPSVDALALPGALAVAEARPQPKLRAGRAEAAAESTGDVKSPAAAPATPVAAAAKGATKVETATAIQATAGASATRETTSNADTMPVSDAAPAEHRAHRLNEAAGPQGHRATTPAALVAQHIIRRFDGKSTSIDVRLDPPELGRVQVSLEVSADNKVSAVVAAENPATLADLVRSARELERALQDAGLDLDGGGLSFDLADRGENAQNDNAGSGGRNAARTDGRDAAPVASRPFGLESWRGARVDVMA
jgi:flagellar hook-length control protein FliK